MAKTALDRALERGQRVSSFAGVELSPGLEEMLSPGGLRSFLSYAATRAGNQWVAKWLPKRWDIPYAVTMLRADPGMDGIPFFSKGRLISIMNRARVRASGFGNEVQLKITMPAGWLSAHPQQMRAFKRLPLGERLDMEVWYKQAMDEAIVASFSGKKSSLKKGISRRGSLNRMMMVELRASRKGSWIAGSRITAQMGAIRSTLIARKRMIRQGQIMNSTIPMDPLRRSAILLPIQRMGFDGRRLAVHRWRTTFRRGAA